MSCEQALVAIYAITITKAVGVGGRQCTSAKRGVPKDFLTLAIQLSVVEVSV